ncbi:hypothetical protein J1605_010770 [Eschrichtius robustus]|uniref:Uncharacterized protein n=1 Tax=Eschrichtius robustus TaxID=9764 RepID=A0AB34GQH7_ESCRO|nr:hypothetical protein J1605_010770 [Eschrichtius robustus]
MRSNYTETRGFPAGCGQRRAPYEPCRTRPGTRACTAVRAPPTVLPPHPAPSERPDAGPPSPPPTGAFQERVGPTMATSSRPGTSGPPSPHGGTSGSAAAAAHEATPAKPTRSGRSRARLTGRGRDECSSLKRPRKQDLTFVGRGGLSRPSGADRLPACSPGAVGGVAELGAKGERGGAGREAATWARPRGISGIRPARSSRAAQPLRTWRLRAPGSGLAHAARCRWRPGPPRPPGAGLSSAPPGRRSEVPPRLFPHP